MNKMGSVDECKNDLGSINNSIKSILSNNNLLTLSTFDNKNKQPCSSTAYFVYDSKFNIYIWTSSKSLHGRNMSKNAKVAINIFDSKQEWGTLLQGLQIFGTAHIVNKVELIKAATLYVKRFPNVSEYIKKLSDFSSSKFEDRLYKIKPYKIKVLDEKAFGKEGFREILF